MCRNVWQMCYVRHRPRSPGAASLSKNRREQANLLKQKIAIVCECVTNVLCSLNGKCVCKNVKCGLTPRKMGTWNWDPPAQQTSPHWLLRERASTRATLEPYLHRSVPIANDTTIRSGRHRKQTVATHTRNRILAWEQETVSLLVPFARQNNKTSHVSSNSWLRSRLILKSV